MNLDFIAEPELEFGSSGRHIDIRFGIMEHGLADSGAERAPSKIRVGIIGAPENAEALTRWLEHCRGEIQAKESRQPNLFPRFPGFTDESAFRCSLVLDSSFNREIPARDIDAMMRVGGHNEIVTAAAERFADEMKYVNEKRSPDVFLCAVPGPIDDLRDPANRPAGGHAAPLLDFRGLLKAKSMEIAVPTQLVVPTTYDRSQRRKQSSKTEHGTKKEKKRPQQDDATKAWNFHTALYYKAGGLPWRMVRDRSEYQTCYVGVSFYYGVDRENVMTSMAQIFDERGDGLVLRGASVKITKEDRTPHLEEQDACDLLKRALDQYRREHGTSPARVVLHKTSRFDAAERQGFNDAAEEEKISRVEFVSITERDSPRLFRNGAYPPLRGSYLPLSAKEHLLYTRGSVDFYATYPGMYVPRPLLFRCDEIMSTARSLAREILALTKMNWNKTQFDESEPITIAAARRVGNVMKYVPADGRIESRYSFYM